MARHHEGLEKSFTDNQKEAFEKFHDCFSEYMGLAEAAIFEYAFKFGIQIVVNALLYIVKQKQTNTDYIVCVGLLF